MKLAYEFKIQPIPYISLNIFIYNVHVIDDTGTSQNTKNFWMNLTVERVLQSP